MEATKLLEKQHDEAIRLGLRLAAAFDPVARRELFVELADVFSAHMMSEERLFYPAIDSEEGRERLEALLDEHRAIKRLIAELLEHEPAEERFEVLRKLLQEKIDLHVEREEAEVFPGVRQQFTRDDLEALGEELENLYYELRQGAPRYEVPAQLEETPLP
ncbi:MAG: hemerythrin domain-containing protein [Myxococcota bacterium]